ncbi:hypothetical protein ACJX0J_040328, partial [Zea mays]
MYSNVILLFFWLLVRISEILVAPRIEWFNFCISSIENAHYMVMGIEETSYYGMLQAANLPLGIITRYIPPQHLHFARLFGLKNRNKHFQKSLTAILINIRLLPVLIKMLEVYYGYTTSLQVFTQEKERNANKLYLFDMRLFVKKYDKRASVNL